MLETYLKMFARLRRANNSIFTSLTKNKAPHKPLLLLAVLDLVQEGVICSPVIDVSGDLVDLKERFDSYWQRVAPLGHTSSIAFPFSRLNSEPFWTLLGANGHIVDVLNLNITNVSQLRRHAVAAKIDEPLFALMQQADSRQALRQVLLDAHFSEEGRAALLEQVDINGQSYEYSRALYDAAHHSLVREAVEEAGYAKSEVRSQGFRRAVVSAYDHRCALCGVRIVTPEGHTAVDAAHIVPWSESRNDDIRNGMALCKLCHWAFDRGMMGINRQYRIVQSTQIAVAPNVPGLLQSLVGREMIPPEDRSLWPAQEYLAHHRRAHRLRD